MSQAVPKLRFWRVNKAWFKRESDLAVAQVGSDGAESNRAVPHNKWRGPAPSTWASLRVGVDPEPDRSLRGVPLGQEKLDWTVWRFRALAASLIVGCGALFWLVFVVTSAPHVEASWRATASGRLELVASTDPALHPYLGQTLLSMNGTEIDSRALQRSARWLVHDADRARHLALHDQLAPANAGAATRLTFADGSTVVVQGTVRGLTRLPSMFWLLAGFGLGLYAVAMVVLWSQPTGRTLAYAVMACCQVGNLVFIAIEKSLDIGFQSPIARLDMPIRMGFDLVTVATLVSAVCLTPRRLPRASWIVTGAWAVAVALIGLVSANVLPGAWWWTQGGVIGLGLLAVGMLSWSYRIEPHPFAIMLRRFTILTVATWVLLSAALAVSAQLPHPHPNVAEFASLAWFVFLASALLLAPFVARTRSVMREFALVSATTTIAISLNVLYGAMFALDNFSSVTLSLASSVGLYIGARHWILNQLLGSSTLTTEQMFEQLYRIARAAEAAPQRSAELLAQLLQELFEPIEIDVVERRSPQTSVSADGSSMLVPVPQLGSDDPTQERPVHMSVRVRFAQRGRHLFTAEDARLTDRIVEQFRRAVHFDKAVEQGRREERQRLAQDLHDDIGARLLTLMYKAQSPEMEEYVRHTLQDLKTLTRGLAASNHRLSHACVEWKADLAHRLSAAHIDLKWSIAFDDDILLTVVQWSALTRILRELVSNAIAHAHARQLEIDVRLESDRMDLTVTDDGVGRSPQTWSHGLGLGGVRKRVKQLGGEVEWIEQTPRGISCHVTMRGLSARG